MYAIALLKQKQVPASKHTSIALQKQNAIYKLNTFVKQFKKHFKKKPF
jgi:hypothetical protein